MHDVVALVMVDFEDVASVWIFDLHDLALVIDEVAELFQIGLESGVWWETGGKSAEHV